MFTDGSDHGAMPAADLTTTWIQLSPGRSHTGGDRCLEKPPLTEGAVAGSARAPEEATPLTSSRCLEETPQRVSRAGGVRCLGGPAANQR